VWEGGGATSVFAAFKKASTPTRQPSAPILTDASLEPADATEFGALMARFRSAAVTEQPTVGAFLDGGKIIARDDDGITIEYPKHLEPSVKMLDRNGKRESLQDVLSRLVGSPTSIRFSISDRVDETPKPAAPNPRPAPRQAPAIEPVMPQQQGIPITEQLRAELMATVPLVKALADEFNARLVKVEDVE